MFGLIFTTQIVNYPLFINVTKRNFTLYHKFYVKKISSIVIPIMLVEFLVSILLLVSSNTFLNMINLIVNVIIFLTTYFIHVPIHNIIKSNYNKSLIKKLIKKNWIRTTLWFLKTVISYNIILKELK